MSTPVSNPAALTTAPPPQAIAICIAAARAQRNTALARLTHQGLAHGRQSAGGLASALATLLRTLSRTLRAQPRSPA